MTASHSSSHSRMTITRSVRSSFALLALALGACQSDSPLAPTGAVPERLTVSLTSTTALASFGDSAIVRARVFDAAGNEVTGAPLVWSVSTPEVLESLGGGVFRSRGNGRAVVRVTVDPTATGARPKGYFADRLLDSVTVTVQQQPARIIPTTADTTFNLLGLTRTISVRVTDARGNTMSQGVTPRWETTNPAVAAVDSTGRMRSRGNGSTQLTVRAGNAVWSTTIKVDAQRTHVSCMRYLKRRQQQQQCVNNTVTMWAQGERTP